MRELNDYFLFLIVILFFFIAFDGIDRPLTYGHNGFATGQNMHMANNYNKVGYALLGVKWNVAWTAETGKEEYHYYTHHPIGIFLLYAPIFAIFGYEIVVGRLVQVIIALLTLVIFYYLIRANANEHSARLATLVLGLAPIFLFYRDMISFDFLGLPLTFLVLIFYMKWLNYKKNKYLVFTLMFAFLGTIFSDWGFYFMSIPVWLHCLIYFKGHMKKFFLVSFPAVFVSSFLLFLLHNYILTGSVAGDDYNLTGKLFENLLFRMNLIESSKAYGITLVGLLTKLWSTSNINLTPIVLWVSLCGILVSINKNYEKRNLKFDNLILFCFMSSLLPVFVLSNAFWIHPHIYLLAVLPFAAYLGVYFLFNINPLSKGTRNVLLSIFIVSLLLFADDFYRNRDEQLVDPLVDFLHKNDENVIWTFPLHPQAFQVRYYLEKRKVLDLRDVASFNNTTLNEYNYVITHTDTEQNLKVFLKSKFESTTVGEFEVFHLKKVRDLSSMAIA